MVALMTDPYSGSMESDDPTEALRRLGIELTSLAESGLAYSQDRFDIERFHRIGALARDLMERVAAGDLPAYDPKVASAAGYATPKIDVRGGVFDATGRVLLAREIADGDKWTLPGGWCDVLETPRQAVEREVREETGVTVDAIHLAAVIDREHWPHQPPYDRHIYKLFFVCEATSQVDLGFTGEETSEIAWFDVHDLPTLSIARVLPEQIRLLHRHWLDPDVTYFD